MFIEICIGLIVICKVGELLLKTVDTVMAIKQLADEEDEPELDEEIRRRMYS